MGIINCDIFDIKNVSFEITESTFVILYKSIPLQLQVDKLSIIIGDYFLDGEYDISITDVMYLKILDLLYLKFCAFIYSLNPFSNVHFNYRKLYSNILTTSNIILTYLTNSKIEFTAILSFEFKFDDNIIIIQQILNNINVTNIGYFDLERYNFFTFVKNHPEKILCKLTRI